MHLVGLIVAREDVHHKVHTEPDCNLALAFASRASADGKHGLPVFIAGPSRRPIVAADKNWRHSVI